MHKYFLRGPGQGFGGYDYMYILSQKKPCRDDRCNILYVRYAKLEFDPSPVPYVR